MKKKCWKKEKSNKALCRNFQWHKIRVDYFRGLLWSECSASLWHRQPQSNNSNKEFYRAKYRMHSSLFCLSAKLTRFFLRQMTTFPFRYIFFSHVVFCCKCSHRKVIIFTIFWTAAYNKKGMFSFADWWYKKNMK